MENQNTIKRENEKDIDLGEIIHVIYALKFFIIKVVSISVIISIIYSLLLPNIYTSEALLAQNSSSGSTSSASDALGGLASITGISLGGMNSEAKRNLITIETLKSRKFFSEYIYEKVLINLMAIDNWDASLGVVNIDPNIYDVKENKWVDGWNKPTIQTAHRQFLSGMDIVENENRGGLVTISIRHKSPNVAKEWVVLIIDSINDAIRKKDIKDSQEAINFLVARLANTKQVSLNEALSALVAEQTKTMMLANISDEYVLKIIDPPVVNELKSSPRRSLIVLLGMLLGFFGAIFMILIRHFYFKKI
tara:strand:+ start:397 stop:1317 length:921 start_codon:yes stop_codon:yes gene_type:complete